MDALSATEITALHGRGTRFEGKLTFEGRVRIDGIFKGEIKSDDVLIIGEGAEVHAEIDVATVIIKGGIVNGNIRAKNSIELHAFVLAIVLAGCEAGCGAEPARPNVARTTLRDAGADSSRDAAIDGESM